MTLGAFVWVDNPMNARVMNWALNEEIRKRFSEAGIKFPTLTRL